MNTQDSQMVRSLDAGTRLVYLQGKPKRGGLVSSRDFCYLMYRYRRTPLPCAPCLCLDHPACLLARGWGERDGRRVSVVICLGRGAGLFGGGGAVGNL